MLRPEIGGALLDGMLVEGALLEVALLAGVLPAGALPEGVGTACAEVDGAIAGAVCADCAATGPGAVNAAGAVVEAGDAEDVAEVAGGGVLDSDAAGALLAGAVVAGPVAMAGGAFSGWLVGAAAASLGGVVPVPLSPLSSPGLNISASCFGTSATVSTLPRCLMLRKYQPP